MGKRRKARETAMQFLYQMSITKNTELIPGPEFWEEMGVDTEVKKFASEISTQAMSHREQIDQLIQQYALHWKIERIAAVDLAILRVAIAEMLFIPSTPPVVVIDESVEIAKRYSTMESGAFVNGILDKIRQEVLPRTSDGSQKT